MLAEWQSATAQAITSRLSQGGIGVGWDEAITGWTVSARAAGRSRQTIWLRTYYLRLLADAYPGRCPWDLATDDIAAWLAERPWAPETRRSAASSVRALYRWALATGRLDRDPTSALPAVRVPAGVPRAIPLPTFAHALTVASPRVRLMLQLGRFAGLRRGEIAAVHTDDVISGTLHVLGKGGRRRLIPVHPVLDRQLGRCPPGWVFPSRAGGHLSAGAVGRLMSAVLPPGWTAHTLRHRAGTDWYAVDRDLLAVQQLLGHERPQTTQRYVQLPDDALRRAVLGVAEG